MVPLRNPFLRFLAACAWWLIWVPTAAVLTVAVLLLTFFEVLLGWVTWDEPDDPFDDEYFSRIGRQHFRRQRTSRDRRRLPKYDHRKDLDHVDSD